MIDETIISINKNSLYDNILFSIPGLLVFFASQLDLKKWLIFEMMYEINAFISFLFYPFVFFAYVLNTPIDSNHRFLMALTGCIINWPVIGGFMLRNSDDPSVFYGRHLARVIQWTLVLIENFIQYLNGTYWNYKLLCFAGSYAVPSLLVSLYYLSKTPKPSANIDHPVNKVAKQNFYILLLAGIVMYLFPGCLPVNVINESYGSIIRSQGANVIGTSFESLFLSNINNLEDKRTVMLARLVSCLIKIPIILLGYYWYNVLGFGIMLAWISLDMVYVLHVHYGYTIASSQKKPIKDD